MSPAGEDRAAVVDRVLSAVRGVPGVVDLHGGALGEAVSLLPGRRVPGIRTGPEGTEVHLALELGRPVREVADAVRVAVGAVAPGPVTVVVEDVVTAEPDADPRPPSDADTAPDADADAVTGATPGPTSTASTLAADVTPSPSTTHGTDQS